MAWLETKVPPLIVGFFCGGVAWALKRLFPELSVGIPYAQWWALAAVATSMGLVFVALWSFRKARTTFDPHHPDRISALVTSGIYGWTRNPMYLGMALMIVAWCLRLSHGLGPIALVLFVVYMNRFQIIPEERVLQQYYGDAYAAYR
ncbi:MAG: isoprenylcysteine carboxylmethyltransferase family protein, partial [Myxococcota bacterium]